MVLMQLLHKLAGKFSWKLHVAHLNHQLRGRASDADERLVVREARKAGLPVSVERAAVRNIARAGKISLEMAARDARHEFLARTAMRLGIRSIALAHHADDQLELFFLRLFRGSGTDGLGGMRWRSPSPRQSAVELVRPCLEVTKAELQSWAKAQRVRFREDTSNAAREIQRNRIRHELIPLLRRRFQPALERTVSRLMELSREDGDCLNAQAKRFLESKRIAFHRQPVALQRRCIQLQLQRAKVAVEYELVERLRTGIGKSVMASEGRPMLLNARGKLLEAVCCGSERSENPKKCPLEIGGGGRARFGALELRWQLGRARGGVPSKKGTRTEYFDADRVGAGVMLRHWRAGDRMQPIGMLKRVKLQDLFTNLKIPRDERHKLVILTTRRGEIIWVQGLRISERFKLSENTIRRLRWQWKPL